MRDPVADVAHLYLHVPFCAAKCKYCAFYSEPGDLERADVYVEAVLRELARWPARVTAPAPALRPVTVFFGGGTPSLLPVPVLGRLLDGLAARVPLGEVREWTIECNPATVSLEKARLYRDHGVNRLSLGVQALDDGLLATLGRIHSAAAAVKTFDQLRQAGFDNLNLDLMFGLPGQTVGHFRATLDRAIALQPEHLSVYCLILEEDTEFGSLFQQGLLQPDHDQERAMFELAIERLAGAGYRQYEVSNFAKPGRECAHNVAYWTGADYLGLGPSACSTVGHRRWQNVADTDRYIAALQAGTSWTESVEELTDATKAAERAAFGMRMADGVPAEAVRQRWAREIAGLLAADLAQWRDGRLRPTRRGILFADAVAAEFVE